jgi:hypothetical protein
VRVLRDELGDDLLGDRGLLLPGVAQRLADLAVVAVDGERLEAELPALEVGLLDVLDGRLFGG